jgi:MinD-like ATPase involved in chromosome partitioning or flagellar assembly
MSRIIALQACRHGIGCSHLVANLAVILMQRGYRVGILDTDPGSRSGGIRTMFGLNDTPLTNRKGYWWLVPDPKDYKELQASFENYEAIANVEHPGIYVPAHEGQFRPEHTKLEFIEQYFGEGKPYETIQRLNEALKLDFLLIDNQPEITDDNLLGLALADIAVVLTQLESYDLQRAAVLLEVIEQLEIVKTWLVPTLVLPTIETNVVVPMLVNTYNHPVAGILYLTAELVTLASQGIFCLHFPDHPLTQTMTTIALYLEQDAQKLFAAPVTDS